MKDADLTHTSSKHIKRFDGAILIRPLLVESLPDGLLVICQQPFFLLLSAFTTATRMNPSDAFRLSARHPSCHNREAVDYAEKARIIRGRGYKGQIMNDDRLDELLQMSGHWCYRCSNKELRELISIRKKEQQSTNRKDLEVYKMYLKRKSKWDLIKTLERLNSCRPFHRFFDLPSELRNAIYELYIDSYGKPSVIAPITPPLALASKRAKRESLQIFYAICTFDIQWYETRWFRGTDTHANPPKSSNLDLVDAEDLRKIRNLRFCIHKYRDLTIFRLRLSSDHRSFTLRKQRYMESRRRNGRYTCVVLGGASVCDKVRLALEEMRASNSEGKIFFSVHGIEAVRQTVREQYLNDQRSWL